MGGHGADDTGVVAHGRHSGLGRPAVRLGGGAGGGEVVDGGEADAARFKAFDPDGAGDGQFALVAAPPLPPGNRGSSLV